MKKKIVKTVSVSLAVLLAAGGISYQAISGNEKIAVADTSKDAKTIQDTIENNIKYNEVGEDKEETVYVLTDANGNVNKKIVSDWLKNKDGSDKLEDKSDLDNIENVKSDADYTSGEDGTIVWNTNGEDVYYQGTTDKELPVDVKVTYLLDGKEMTPSEIAGKSGKVTIKFQYINNQKKEISINGKKTEMYVPFTMISGMILDGNKFRNVEVNSGKVISDGNRLVVVGLGFPGMNSNLNIADAAGDKNLNFPDTVEVTADVEDFSLALTLTMGSADLLSAVDVDNVTAVEDLKEVVNKLVESTAALQSGSTKISEGLRTLKTSFGTYSTGIKTYVTTVNSNIGLLNEKLPEFTDGTKALSAGVNKIADAMEGEEGAVTGANKLAEGSKELNSGLDSLSNKVGKIGNTDDKTLTGGVNNIAAGSKKLFSYVDKMLAGFDDGKNAQGDINYGLSNGSKAVAEGVEELAGELTDMVTTMQKSIADNEANIEKLNMVLKGGKNPSTGKNLTDEEIAVYNAQIQQLSGANTALKSMLQSINPEEMNSQLNTLKDGANGVASGVSELQTGLKEFKKEGNTLVTGAEKLNSSMAELVSGIDKLKAGSVQIEDGAVKLAGGVSELYDAVKNQLQPGVSTLYDGANLLATSVNKLYEGTKTTSKDVNTLLEGTDKLASGIDELSTGADTLNTGLKQYGDAINKVSDFTNGDLMEITEKIKSTISLAKEYRIYSDAVEGKSTSVKFIYETEGIETE